MSISTRQLYEFGVFRLDTRERLLLRNGERVKLEGRVFETLVVLIQNSGHSCGVAARLRVVRDERLLSKVD